MNLGLASRHVSEHHSERQRILQRTQSSALRQKGYRTYHLANNVYSKQNTGNTFASVGSENSIRSKSKNRSTSSKSLFNTINKNRVYSHAKLKIHENNFITPTKDTFSTIKQPQNVKTALQQILIDKINRKNQIKIKQQIQGESALRRLVSSQVQKNISDYNSSALNLNLSTSSNLFMRKENLEKSYNADRFNSLVSQCIQTQSNQGENKEYKNKKMLKTQVYNIEIMPSNRFYKQNKNDQPLAINSSDHKKSKIQQKANIFQTALLPQNQLTLTQLLQYQSTNLMPLSQQQKHEKQPKVQQQPFILKKQQKLPQNYKKQSITVTDVIEQPESARKFIKNKVDVVQVKQNSQTKVFKQKQVKQTKQDTSNKINKTNNQINKPAVKVKQSDCDSINFDEIQSITLAPQANKNQQQKNTKKQQNIQSNPKQFPAAIPISPSPQPNPPKQKQVPRQVPQKITKQISKQHQKHNQKSLIVQSYNTAIKIIDLMTPVGQVAGYCAQLLKKSKLNWHTPAILLYKQCYQKFQKYQQLHLKAANLGVIQGEECEKFIQDNKILEKNLAKIVAMGKKKGKLSTKYQQIVTSQQPVQLSAIIQKQVIEYSKTVLQDPQQKQNNDTLSCLLRMINSVKIIAQVRDIKVKDVQQIQKVKLGKMGQAVRKGLEEIGVNKLKF